VIYLTHTASLNPTIAALHIQGGAKRSIHHPSEAHEEPSRGSEVTRRTRYKTGLLTGWDDDQQIKTSGLLTFQEKKRKREGNVVDLISYLCTVQSSGILQGQVLSLHRAHAPILWTSLWIILLFLCNSLSRSHSFSSLSTLIASQGGNVTQPTFQYWTLLYGKWKKKSLSLGTRSKSSVNVPLCLTRVAR
jgi:hypothetical protein